MRVVVRETSMNTVVRGIIAICCLLAATAQLPHVMEHLLSTFAAEHFFSPVAYDHIRPILNLVYYAFQMLAFMYFAVFVTLRPADKRLGVIGLTIMAGVFLERALCRCISILMLPSWDIYCWVTTIACLVMCLVMITYILVLYAKLVVSLQTGLFVAGIGMLAAAACMVCFIIRPMMEIEGLNHLPIFIDLLELSRFYSFTVIISIAAIGVLFPVFALQRTQSESENSITITLKVEKNEQDVCHIRSAYSKLHNNDKTTCVETAGNTDKG